MFSVPAHAITTSLRLEWSLSSQGGFAEAVAIDPSGDAYVIGSFEGTVDFDPGPGETNLVSNGDLDVFIAVYRPTGEIIGAQSIGGVGRDIGTDIAVDTSTNLVHIAGRFSGTVDFDPGRNETNLVSGSDGDVFAAIYPQIGFPPLHVFKLGGAVADQGVSIAVDTAAEFAGHTVVAGSFQGQTDFDPGPSEAILGSTSSHAFVAIYDTFGRLVKAFTIGGAGFETVHGVAVDENRQIYVIGHFEGTVDFDPGPGETPLTSKGDSDAFIALYDMAGMLIRADQIGGSDSVRGHAIAVDSIGTTYLTGEFTGTVDFDPSAGETLLTTTVDTGAFVATYDPSGGLVAAYQLGGESGSVSGEDIAVDFAGNVHVTGNFSGTADFDPGIGEYRRTSIGDSDAFIAVYDPIGTLVHAHNIGGPDSDRASGIAVDANGASHIIGEFRGTVDLDPGPKETMATGDPSLFAIKVAAASCGGKPITIDLNLDPQASGTSGRDVILGTPGEDVIDGLEGNDTICGEQGHVPLRQTH